MSQNDYGSIYIIFSRHGSSQEQVTRSQHKQRLMHLILYTTAEINSSVGGVVGAPRVAGGDLRMREVLEVAIVVVDAV